MMTPVSSVYSNLHVHGDSVRSVTAAVRAEQVLPAYVSTATGPWVSVYPESTEHDDPRALIDVAESLQLGVVATGNVHYHRRERHRIQHRQRRCARRRD